MGIRNRIYTDEIRDDGRGSFLILSTAMQLRSHPQLSGSTMGIRGRVAGTFRHVDVVKIDGGFRVEGSISFGKPVYCVVAYTDPQGSSNYDATSQTAVSRKIDSHSESFAIDCIDLRPGSAAILKLTAYNVNGSNSTKQFPFAVASDGTVDLGTIKKQSALRPIGESLNDRIITKAKARADH